MMSGSIYWTKLATSSSRILEMGADSYYGLCVYITPPIIPSYPTLHPHNLPRAKEAATGV